MDSHLERLFQHLEWANGRLLEALDRAAAPPGEAIRLLAHVLGAERVWLDRIQGLGDARPDPWPALSLGQARELCQASVARFRTVLRTAPAERLAAPIAYVNSRGEAFRNSLEDILLHVALHGAHHRGQIAALLRQAGLEPAVTDYIGFARAGQGPAEAPAHLSPLAVPGPGPAEADAEPGPIGM